MLEFVVFAPAAFALASAVPETALALALALAAASRLARAFSQFHLPVGAFGGLDLFRGVYIFSVGGERERERADPTLTSILPAPSHIDPHLQFLHRAFLLLLIYLRFHW